MIRCQVKAAASSSLFRKRDRRYGAREEKEGGHTQAIYAGGGKYDEDSRVAESRFEVRAMPGSFPAPLFLKVSFFVTRVAAGLPMPGVLAVTLATPYHIARDDIIQSALYGLERDWANQVKYPPLL